MVTGSEAINLIKNKNWLNALGRPGFLQSKAIVIEAEMQPVTLTDNLVLQYDSELWVKESNLYDDTQTQGFSEKFTQAFATEPKWPVDMFDQYQVYADRVVKFAEQTEQETQENTNKENRLELFGEYVNLLIQIQKHYVVAAPLAAFCEQQLSKIDPDLPTYATPYARLAMEMYNDSLRTIRSQEPLSAKALAQHIKEYGWIKNTYNISSFYTTEEATAAVKTTEENELPEEYHGTEAKNPYFIGLRISMYLRNRTKELSQQLWYYFEPLGQIMANDLGISRDDFFQMTYQEVLESYEKEMVVTTAKDFEDRKLGFVTGFVDEKQILLAGQDALNLYEFYNPKVVLDNKPLTGQIACKGFATGKVSIILGQNDFNKFSDGAILVTTMTTPDYMLLMKRAAAIVTDEGGITSHAAIISRELKKPCIIGTKIATHALKNGDVVEVDANNGIIKILERA